MGRGELGKGRKGDLEVGRKNGRREGEMEGGIELKGII